jgi:hypothetical protein
MLPVLEKVTMVSIFLQASCDCNREIRITFDYAPNIVFRMSCRVFPTITEYMLRELTGSSETTDFRDQGKSSELSIRGD